MMPRRLLIGIAAAGALAAVTPAFAAPTPVPSIDAQAAAVADSPRVEGAQARIATAQARVDAVSAQLSELRQRMVGATPEEGDALREEEARLEALKDLRVDGVGRAAEDAARIAEDERDAAGEADRQAAAPSTTGVVLAPGSLDVSATPPAADAAPPAVTSSPAVPALPAPAAGGAADAASIDAFLAAKGSPLTGLGAVFVAEAQRVGLDPRFIVAIAGAETSFGTYGPSQTIHNPFGLGPGMDFASWPEAIRYAASNLAGPLYLGRGHTTIGSIAGVWAPIGAANDPGNLNNHWTQNVGMYYAAQGGDPNAPVFTGAPAPTPVAAPVFAPTQGLATPAVTNAGPAAAADALELLGTPHPQQQPRGGLDDVGLVRAAYSAQGVSLPTRPNALGLKGEPIGPMRLRAGDVVLFGSAATGNRVVHMGLYLGAGQFVHAAVPGDVVRLASMYDPVWAASYLGARRI